jgi:hypothetical protein
MKIRAGYEITYDRPQPTPMIVELSVHPIRRSDLITPDAIRLEPPVPIKEYRDGFGNICQVIKAPKGEITMFSDFLIEDSGKPDEIAPDIVDHALEKLPVETLVYLLGSRYCETDRLSEFAWARLGTFPKGGALVQAFATSCIRRSRSAMSTRAWRGQPLTHSTKCEGCAATSPTSPSRSAAA